MFTKHLFAHYEPTTQDRKNLYSSKRSSSIAGHLVCLHFFHTSAVCLLFCSWCVNSHHKDFLDLVFWPFMDCKPLKTTFSDKILKKISPGTLFRSPMLFWFFAPNCKQTALSLEIRMVDKFCLHIFSSHEVPQLWGEFEFLRCRDCPTYSCISS